VGGRVRKEGKIKQQRNGDSVLHDENKTEAPLATTVLATKKVERSYEALHAKVYVVLRTGQKSNPRVA